MNAMPGQTEALAAGIKDEQEETIDAVSRNLALLFPLFHRKIISRQRGISGMQLARLRVLGVLIRYGPLPISKVGKWLYISKSYMTRLVDDLIEEDLVERLPDESDRRVINIRITEKGRRRSVEIGTMLKSDIADILSDLSDDDIRILGKSLKNLYVILGKLQDS
jgi:DNA-binding MarR family transcriptional regulator